MRKIILLLLVIFTNNLMAQVGIDTDKPHDSSILHVESSDKGVLFPRLSETERDAITDPAVGLMIYNITYNTIQVNTGSEKVPNWQNFNDGTRAATINCSNIQILGDYYAGFPVNAEHKLIAPFTEIGNTGYADYQIYTDDVNGVNFFASNDTNFITDNHEYIVPAAGTPIQAGVQNYVLRFNQNECPFTIDVKSGQPPLQIGQATGEDDSDRFPLDPNSNYSYSETLYKKQDLNLQNTTPLVINNIAYHVNKADTGSVGNVRIYMGLSSESAIANTSYGHTAHTNNAGEFTLVYDGAFPNSGLTGWEKITLDNNFTWSNGSNIIIVVIKNQGDTFSYGEGPEYSTSTFTEYRTGYDDGYSAVGFGDGSMSASKDAPIIRFNVD